MGLSDHMHACVLTAAQLATMLAAKEVEMIALKQKLLQKQIADLQVKQRKQHEERERKQVCLHVALVLS